MGVPVSTLLARKDSAVATITPDATIAEVTAELAAHNVGALVVSQDGRTVDGVISERDIVRLLARAGADALDERVDGVMTSEVVVCERTTSTNELIVMMTERRIRHVPVVSDGELAGIVSIGDIVKWRMDELTEEAKQLETYVSGSY